MATIPAFNPSLYDWSDPANPQPLQGFAAHVADPKNLQAIAPALTQPQSVVPQKPPSFWDAKANWFQPQKPNNAASLQPQNPAVNASIPQEPVASWFQPQGKSQVLPPAQNGQAFNSQPSVQPRSGATVAPQNVADWFKPSAQTQADQQQLVDLQKSGAGLNKINNPFLKGLARVGDVIGTMLTPGVATVLPGTTLHNRALQEIQQNRINNDVKQDQARAQAAMQGLQAQDTLAQINQRNAQTAQIPILTRAKQMQAQQMGAAHGLKPTFDENGNQTGWEPDPDSPVFQRQQAQNDYFAARKELADAQAALANAKNDPNSPAFQQAQQRLAVAARNAQTAAGRLGLSEKTYMMHAYGTDAQGNALPGAMLLEDGTPVGTANAENLRPTAKQRDKVDLANNAIENINAIKEVVNRRKDLFGPTAGRGTNLSVWLGSQDPDAQRVRAAMEGGSLALAGIHGTRGQYSVAGLQKMLGDFKSNPAALNAGLDQLIQSSKSFHNPGGLRVAGERGALGSNQPKRLGAQTAKQFLQQAGGDKAKARQLALQAGYAQ
jgi:hypothetical protein